MMANIYWVGGMMFVRTNKQKWQEPTHDFPGQFLFIFFRIALVEIG